MMTDKIGNENQSKTENGMPPNRTSQIGNLRADSSHQEDAPPMSFHDPLTAPPAVPPIPKTRRSLTPRGIALAIILNITYTLINVYLGLNFGMTLGFGIITVLTAYVLFHLIRGGSSRQEITTTMVASSGFTFYYIISICIYIQAYVPDSNLPWWLIPSYEVLMTGGPLHPAWLVPILFHFTIVLTSTVLGFVTALTVSELVLSRKKATFPFYRASGVTIDSCFQTGHQTRFMFKWLGIGVAITLSQYTINFLIEPYGLNVLSWDFTPILPTGFALGFTLNIGIMAVAYIIDPKVSITLLFAGTFTYLILAPLLTVAGRFTPVPTGMDFYFNLLFQFSLSPALGIMLLSGFVVLGINKLKTKTRGLPPEQDIDSISDKPENRAVEFGGYARGVFTGMARNPRLAGAYALLVALFLILVVGLGIFSPFPFWVSIALSLVLLVPIAIIDVFILIKFVGEAGIGMGAQRLAFYEIPLATTGLYGYTPFLAYPAINPWYTTDTLGNLKIARLTGTPKRALLTAQLLNILPGSITSVVFILAAWYFIGFPSETFPAVGVLQGYAIVSVFATRSFGTALNPLTFLLGGLVSGLLAAFTPIAPLGIALAMFLPPSY
ncbi:MAG: OPT/YSL family transporter, partial [Candidatus Hodarchaeota archaeon]